MSARAQLVADGSHLMFECPGCEQAHVVPVKPGGKVGPWTWNGSVDAPTLAPSILARWTHGDRHEPRVCHSFVNDGRIQFLGDCTHALAGQTVDLPEIRA